MVGFTFTGGARVSVGFSIGTGLDLGLVFTV